MTTVFWLLTVCLMGLAGVCASQSSCYREQRDTLRARETAGMAVMFLLLAVLFGIAAGVWR